MINGLILLAGEHLRRRAPPADDATKPPSHSHLRRAAGASTPAVDVNPAPPAAWPPCTIAKQA